MSKDGVCLPPRLITVNQVNQIFSMQLEHNLGHYPKPAAFRKSCICLEFAHGF